MAFALTDRQREANRLLGGSQKHTLLRGGSRSGKTFLIIRAIAVRALRGAESRHAVLRLRSNAARSSIWLDTLPKVFRVCFPTVPLEWHKQDGYVGLPNRSQIWVGGLDDAERAEKILGMEFCVDPESKVLTSDLRWVAAKDVAVGQKLVGFPEDLDGHCKLEPSKVERHDIIEAEKCRIVTDKGETVVSAQHQFVAHYDDRRHRNFRQFSWRKAEDLRVGDRVRFTTSPWETPRTYDDGWFAGMLDGEGWCLPKIRQLGVAQRGGPVLDAMKAWLDQNGIGYLERNDQKEGYEPCYKLIVRTLWDAMKVLGMTQPKRLNARALWDGCRAFRNPGHDATILRIEPLGRGPVVSMSTSTKTFIADGFLAHNCSIFYNECSQIPYSSVLMARTRLAQQIEGLAPREYFDCNPSGTSHYTYKLFREHRDPETGRPVNPNDYAEMAMNPVDNRANIAASYIETLQALPDKQRRRFFEGEWSPEVEGALWSIEVIDKSRIVPPEGATYDSMLLDGTIPPLVRVVVAVDPSGCSGKEESRSDEIGVVVAGRGVDGKGYVLADRTVRLGPAGWGRVVAQAYGDYRADAVVAEQNFGGAMVEHVIRTADPNIPVLMVNASRGKAVRAEPVSALYEQDMVRHVGTFPALEEQMINMSMAGYVGSKSPDRMDALVWALSELMLGQRMKGFALYELERLAALEREDKAAVAALAEANRPVEYAVGSMEWMQAQAGG